ncbi:MAG: UDP-N-acetylmuramoyl-L-alanyl-D-glutamate--2,6-diaminopimelate ligase [Gemmatimonadetes bacterium]|nr:UDP-N-acetylmuramoyl-L-alanyl-D-glutamate--2,6-diaminopimelate ligase [Gemmatimonadota bacterium]
MELRRIADALDARGELVRAPDAAPEIAGVVDDSRRVDGAVLFCAVQGTVADGHDYVADAAARGAVAALVTRVVEAAIPQVVVRDSRIAAAVAAATWYDRPGDALRLVGVTGTNGKSTTVSLTRHLMNAAGDVAALGTLGVVGGAGERLPDATGLTTPGPVELQATLAALRDRGVRTVVMEISSHALHQRRTAELSFQAGVYTNLTHEHLDYHGELDAYLAAKALLSDQIEDDGIEVINADDPAWEALPSRDRVRRISYGVHRDATVRAVAVEADATGSALTIRFETYETRTVLPLLGEFNVSNALAAAAAAWGLGGEPEAVAGALRDAPQVPGRMERLVSERYTVLRDYAHTPDAMLRVLRTLRRVTAARLIVLFGCGGDRDRGKRAVMGKIAASEADVVILTADNPRTEDPERILDDIAAGMAEVPHLRILDRQDAIHRALTMLAPGDCLLLAGKGHETYQIFGTEKHPFDERVIVLDALGSPAA